jgi:NAD(P)-dependent dehydrogenase (short-subunit alcohol dehydrogenase family)
LTLVNRGLRGGHRLFMMAASQPVWGLWSALKVWRKICVGPVTFMFGFRRRAYITPGVSSHRAAAWYVRAAQRQIEAADTAFAESDAPVRRTGATCGSAVIVGVGPGFGYALARRLAWEGFDLVLVARNAARLAPLVEELATGGVRVESIGADATDERDVSSLFSRIAAGFGIPSLVVYGLQEFGPGETLDITLPAFESAWRHNCLGAFLVSQAAGRSMRPAGAGSIVLVGSTSSLIGRAGHLTLAVGKFGQRALAQVLARELWPAGIHVAHIMIDADVLEDPARPEPHAQADPADIADAVLAIHRQPKSAWSSEIDLRPWNERFWEHC